MLSQEDFQSVQLLRDALDVIKTINTDYKLHTLELTFQGRNSRLDFGLLESFNELFRVNTNWKSGNSYVFALELDTVRRGN